MFATLSCFLLASAGFFALNKPGSAVSLLASAVFLLSINLFNFSQKLKNAKTENSKTEKLKNAKNQKPEN